MWHRLLNDNISMRGLLILKYSEITIPQTISICRVMIVTWQVKTYFKIFAIFLKCKTYNLYLIPISTLSLNVVCKKVHV